MIITQVVPHYQAPLPIVENFHQALQDLEQSQTPSFGAFEGYIASRILILALKNMEGEPSREKIIDALESLGKFTLGTLPLHLSKEEHQASHQVWPTIIKNGKVVPFSWQELAIR